MEVKVLIADDDLMSRDTMVEALTDGSEAAIICAANGDEAWDKLKLDDPPRLILLDWGLPNSKGVEICRSVRNAASAHYIYIVALGERWDDLEMLAALQAGADDYLAKPLNPEALLARVQIGRRVLEKEERLDQIIQGWRTMVDNLPFGVACLGPRGELMRANMLFASLIGVDIKPLLGKSLGKTVFGKREEFAWLLDNIRRKRSFDRTIIEMRPYEGRASHLVMWGRPLDGESEMVYQIIAGSE